MTDTPADRLEYLRSQLRAERISYYELAELQGLAERIDPSDVELLEAAGVPEYDDDECEAIEIDGPPAGEPLGRCSCGRPLYRSHFAGTIYHSTEN